MTPSGPANTLPSPFGFYVEAQPDATLAEFQEQLQQKTGVLIGIATVDRMIRLKLKLTLKKVSIQPKNEPTRFNWLDLSTGNS